MSEVRLEPFNADMTAEAARMLARAFVTNPLHVAAFGAGELGKNKAFFRVGLRVMREPKLVALDGSRMLGLIHWVPAPRCQLSALEKLKVTPHDRQSWRDIWVRASTVAIKETSS